jgi:Icc protein
MRIAVIGDLHYPLLNESNQFIAGDRQSFYETVLKGFFSIPADLYVSIGDLTNFGWKEELVEIYAIIDKHKKPFLHVLGNHDVYGMTRHDVLTVTQQQRFHMLSTETVVLAFLDTAQEQNYTDWGGTLDLVQQEWLETVIEEAGDRPLLVFGHHPVYSTTTHSEKDKRCISQDVPVWEILSKKQGAGLYVNGHNHFNSIAVRDQWTFLQLAAVLDEQAFRVIEVSDSLISIDKVSIVNPHLKEQAAAIGNAIDHFTLKNGPVGTEDDAKYTIPLSKPAPLAVKQK